MFDGPVLYVGEKPTLIRLVTRERNGALAQPYGIPAWKATPDGVVDLLVADDGLSAVASPVGVGIVTIEAIESAPEKVKPVKTDKADKPAASDAPALNPAQQAALDHENALRADVGAAPLAVEDAKAIPALPKSTHPDGAWGYTAVILEVRPANGHALLMSVGMPGVGIPDDPKPKAKAA